ncbi:hypothetical protein [Leifsonia sp. Leaf264]|uniref:hypothetical protein n=1 Tax=Leifsonia sp. Leaf264 TaxID=1736314 RepID=UPI0012FB3772|nr:hypothetical protein [Leifsonia sp. Leaf264]
MNLDALDGERTWSYALWPLPNGQRMKDLEPFVTGDQFLQSAGTAGAMSIELREIDGDGHARQFAIGRPDTYYGAGHVEAVVWSAGVHALHLFPGEVFGADEAAAIYFSYYSSGTVPAAYRRRELDQNS